MVDQQWSRPTNHPRHRQGSRIFGRLINLLANRPCRPRRSLPRSLNRFHPHSQATNPSITPPRNQANIPVASPRSNPPANHRPVHWGIRLCSPRTSHLLNPADSRPGDPLHGLLTSRRRAPSLTPPSNRVVNRLDSPSATRPVSRAGSRPTSPQNNPSALQRDSRAHVRRESPVINRMDIHLRSPPIGRLASHREHRGPPRACSRQ